jgi:putative addiction module component (TIGR02574 family)
MLPAEEIFEAAVKLEPGERARLVAELSATLHGLDLGDEWEDEIARRVDDLDAGRVKTIPDEQVFAHLDRRFGGK